ncbi:MAG: large extracellular alpha-helical protein [Gammaproteobacteria bacterium]|nr:large extracellular alpha-helical protein [Gammaproteobacteria bacterium]
MAKSPVQFGAVPQTLAISRITPEGKDVPAGRQIVFQFNRPVVPVGKMDRDAKDIPITITPALACSWRWLNTSALACQLGEASALRPATRYRVLVQPGISAEGGLAAPRRHTFITQRPKISWLHFMTWTAPGMPEIRVTFTQPVSRASVERHLYFSTKTRNSRRVRAVVRMPDKEEEKNKPEYSAVWVITPQKALPGNTKIRLKIEPGLRSESGPETGVEKRTVKTFDSFPKFKFLGVRCTSNDNKRLMIKPGQKSFARKRCNPLESAALLFSSPVDNETIKSNMRFTPDLAGGRTDYDPWENVYSYSGLNRAHKKGVQYEVQLPEVLKAYETYRLRAKRANFKDGFGRPLAKSIDMRFATDHRLPDFTFDHSISVLETGVDSEVPIFVTNLQALDLEYSILTAAGAESGLQAQHPVAQAPDIAFKIPLEIRDLIPAESGVIQGTFDTLPATRHDRSAGRWFFAQVTPFHVQIKAGHHNTLVWVTNFADGLPAAGVDVGVYPGAYSRFTEKPQMLAAALTDAEGIAMLPGLETLDPKLGLLEHYDREKNRLFVRCQKGRDLALIALDYNFAVDMYELSEDYLYAYSRKRYGHIHTWGTTAQGVYKAGDTVQYKILVRDQSNTNFIAAPRSAYTLKVMDPMDKIVHEIKNITLSEFGGADGEFTLPKTAAAGWYGFQLSADFTNIGWQPMRVLVSDFTPSPFRVRTMLNGTLFHAGDQLEIDTTATLHAGGPYANAHAQVYVQLRQEPFIPENPIAKGFSFDVVLEEESDSKTVHHTESETDDKGRLQTAFTLPDSAVLYGRLQAESAVRDDRGKDVAASASARYVGRDRYVGLKETAWVLQQGKSAIVQWLVTDEHGNPAIGTPVEMRIQRRVTKAARVKSAGNAYLTQYTHKWEDAGACSAVSGKEPGDCAFTPLHSGIYRIIADIRDTQDRTHTSTLRQWVSGKGAVVWETSPSHGLTVIPEKKTYRVGETARYLIKNPYPGAKALITIERYGILKHWVQTFENSVQVLEFPIEADYIPGYFLSVLVTSPRTDKPLGKNLVDLGKPAFRMGYVQVDVKDPYKELLVDIDTDKPVYKPRQEVILDLHAKARQAGVTEPVELAVAVLDESVLDLLAKGRDYFDPYKGFYTLDELDVKNFNILLRLVGRQKFEKKGANPGGDGGGADLSLRSVFKFVSYWNPAIKTDEAGRAQVKFQVPDNLTGWRVLAMAVTPGERMGLGDANFKVNLPVEVRPVLPNQVTEGDSFQAGFSVMNRSETTRTLKVDIRASGPLKIINGAALSGVTQSLTVAPYKRKTVWLPLQTADAGKIKLSAFAGDEEVQDGLTKTLTVRKRRALNTSATYGSTVESEVTENIAFPKEIHPDAGGVRVTLSPTIIGGAEGAFAYMRDYPYACWEQKLSKGVMASHYQNLRDWLPDSLRWKESAELPRETLEVAAEFQAPNGGMSFYIPHNDRVSPYLSAYTALAFGWLREAGHEIPAEAENKLHEYLLTLLRRDVMPDFYSQGMASSVRATALAALAKQGKIDVSDIKRYRSHLPEMSLFGKAEFLAAAMRVADTEEIRNEAAAMIYAQSSQSGGKISFNETLDDGFSRILASPLRDNCAILSALTEYQESQGTKADGDIPAKLARSIVAARKSRTHWENTQENLFCMNALTDYARAFEKDKPEMLVRGRLGEQPLGETQFSDVKNPPVSFEHAMTPADPGRKTSVKLTREGTGRLYYGVRLAYAEKAESAQAVNAGIEVRREYSIERDGKWVLLESPMALKTGDLVRVDLFLSLPAARNFVVVDDPVPGGLEPVNRDLATASTVAADKAGGRYAGGSAWFSYEDWHEYGFSRWSFYHKELRHHAAIFYSDYLPPGNYHLSYVAQAITPGEFAVMPVHAEEMYEPDVYGKGKPAVLRVGFDAPDVKPAAD